MHRRVEMLWLAALLVIPRAHADPGVRKARGFSTLLPITLDPQKTIPAHRDGFYVATPSVATSHAAFAPRRTTPGRLADYMRCVFGGCGPASDPAFLPARVIDPNSGASIGAFGPAYQDAGPVGHGLASHEAAAIGYGH